MSEQVINGQAAAVENPATTTPQAPAPAAGTPTSTAQPTSQEGHIPGYQKRINELTAVKYQQADQIDELTEANARLLQEAEYYRSLNGEGQPENQPESATAPNPYLPQPPAPDQDPYLALLDQNPEWKQSKDVINYMISKAVGNAVKPLQEEIANSRKSQKEQETARIQQEVATRQRQILTNIYQATAKELELTEKQSKISAEHVHGEVAALIAATPQFRAFDDMQKMAVIRDMYRHVVGNIRTVFGASAAQAATATPAAVPGAAPAISQMPGTAPTPNPMDKYRDQMKTGMSREEMLAAVANDVNASRRPGG